MMMMMFQPESCFGLTHTEPDDDDVYYDKGKRLKLTGETEKIGVGAKRERWFVLIKAKRHESGHET